MLRHLLITILLALGLSQAYAGGIDFFTGTYQEALELAQAEGKLVFVDAYAVWCGPCKRMSTQVFPREDVGAFFNENFVSLKIDMERGPGKEFGRIFPVSSYPTLLFISSQGELVQRVIGAQAPENLIQQAQLALRKTDKSESFAKRYREGERDPKVVLEYIKSLNKAGKPSLAVANEFLRDNKDHANADVQAVIFESMLQVDSRIFELFIEQRAGLESAFGKDAVANRIEKAAEQTMENGLTYNAEKLIVEAKEAMLKHVPSRAKAFDAKADMAIAKRKKDSGLAYKAARKVVIAAGNTPAANYEMAIELNRYFASQPKAMELAVKMAGVAAKSEPNFDHLYTYASLLAEQGKDKKAIVQAERAAKLLTESDDPRRAVMVTELLDKLNG